MEIIYFIALEITIMLLLFKFLSTELVVIISLIIIIGGYLFQRKKSIFSCLIPLIFLIRAFSLFNTTSEIGDIRKFQIFLYEGRGKIEKIDNHFPIKNSYTYITGKESGNYLISGKIKDIEEKYGNIYYTIDIEMIEKLKINKFKEYFEIKSRTFLKDSSYSLKRVYDATILGDGYRLTKEMREKYNYTGISHLIALSGFHVGIVIGVFTLFVKRISLKKRAQNILLLIFLTIYYLGVEHSASLDRAYIMGVIYLLGKIFDENSELIKSLVVSYVLSLCINPASSDTVSFQLSYGAVFIIAGIYPTIKSKIYRGKSNIIDYVILTLTIQIFLTPLLIKTLGVVQLLSFISNLIVVPVGSLFIFLAFMGLFLENFYLGFLLLPPLKLVFYVFNKLVDLFYTIPLMSIKCQIASPFLTLFYYILILGVFILKFRKEKNKDEKIYRRTKISQ